MAEKPITKAQLIAQIADKMEMTKKDVNCFFDILNEITYKETKKKGSVTVPGMGKLVLQKRKARMGRNPQTGEAIKIKAKTVVKFRIAKACKDAIIPPKK
jgi:DNA-binding protein HU-beta